MSEKKKTTKKDVVEEEKKTTKPKKETVKKTVKAKVAKEEVKVEVVKEEKPKKETALLDKSNQKVYKVLSKIIYVLAKIVKVLLMICVPFIFLAMILVPIIFKGFEVSGNIIKFNDASIIVHDESLSIKMGDGVRTVECDAVALEKLTTFLNENSKGLITTYVELALFLAGAILILDIYLFGYIEKIFGNFYKKETPFIKENLDYIFHICICLVILKAIDCFIFLMGLSNNLNSAVGIVDILIVFVIYFIFKYAVGIQKKVDTKMCD